jgi:hypothetical protein
MLLEHMFEIKRFLEPAWLRRLPTRLCVPNLRAAGCGSEDCLWPVAPSLINWREDSIVAAAEALGVALLTGDERLAAAPGRRCAIMTPMM